MPTFDELYRALVQGLSPDTAVQVANLIASDGKGYIGGGSSAVLSGYVTVFEAVAAGASWHPAYTFDQQVGTDLVPSGDGTQVTYAAGLYLVLASLVGPSSGAPTAVSFSPSAPNGFPALPYDTNDPWTPVVQSSRGAEANLTFVVQGSSQSTFPPLDMTLFGNASPWTPTYCGVDIRKIG